MNPLNTPQESEPSSPCAPDAKWKIELFGGVRARRLFSPTSGEAPQTIETFRTQKTGALLAFLSLERRQHGREWLAELLWPDVSIDAARNSLRVSLSSLRSVLETEPAHRGRVLRSSREGVGAGELLTTDLEEFRAAVRSAERQTTPQSRIEALEAALSLVNAPLLRGFYDDWAVSAARRFERELLGVARTVMSAREEQEQWLLALDCARRAAMIVPDSDTTMRDVVRLGVRAGESSGVRREFEAWKRRRQGQGLETLLDWDEFALVQAGRGEPSIPPPDLSADVPVVAHEAAKGRESGGRAFGARELPLPLSSFVGRAREREAVGELLVAPHSRLVTILGMGGAGKTRLALEIARRARESKAWEAVAWVSAAPVGSVRGLQSALFEALGVPEENLAENSAFLSRRILLVLDNFEHLEEAGALWLGQLLERAPRWVVLVTSRVALRIAGERLWFLAPLSSESSDETARDEERGGDAGSWPDAVRLFVERAQGVRPDFSPTPEEVEDIARLCAVLGGSPLAIEVAAARVALFSPSALWRELHAQHAAPAPASGIERNGLWWTRTPAQPREKTSTSLLDWPNRDVNAPARHRTLRHAIEWSVRQLPPRARTFWARASEFRASFSPEAARVVCDEPNVPPLLLALRDSSLLDIQTQGETPCGVWNEALREFALDLLSPDERASCEARHATFFAERARLLAADTPTASFAAQWQRERADVHAAFAWFLKCDVEGALDMGAALGCVWEATGSFAQGRALLERALEAASSQKLGADASDNAMRGLLSRARAGEGAARLCLLLFDTVSAKAHLEKARQAFERAGDTAGAARVVESLKLASLRANDFVLAPPSAGEEADPAALYNLSFVARVSGDFAAARALASQALPLYRAGGDRHGIALCLETLGQVELLSGQPEAARIFFEGALATFTSLGENAGAARARWGLGHIARLAGDFALARAHLAGALELSRGSDNSWALPYLLEAFALLAGAQNRWSRAVRLLIGAQETRLSGKTPLPAPYFQRELRELELRCERELGTARFEAERAVAGAMSRDDLLRLALDDEPGSNSPL